MRFSGDFFDLKSNTVIEIKSTYTYEVEKEQNEAKKEATLKDGFNFMFVIDKDYTNFYESVESKSKKSPASSESSPKIFSSSGSFVDISSLDD